LPSQILTRNCRQSLQSGLSFGDNEIVNEPNARRSLITVILVLGIPLVLLVLMLLGMGYPVVGRGDTVPGVPDGLLLWGILLSALYSGVTVALARSRHEPPKALMSPLVGLFSLGVVLITGALLYLNGSIDRSDAKTYETVTTGKYVHRMRGTDYFVMTRDWRDSTRIVRLRVEPDTFRRIDVSRSAPVTVTTRDGFLGFERLVGVRQE
jgi:hypothetical protein